jgi:hypothetical protein
MQRNSRIDSTKSEPARRPSALRCSYIAPFKGITTKPDAAHRLARRYLFLNRVAGMQWHRDKLPHLASFDAEPVEPRLIRHSIESSSSKSGGTDQDLQ